jgi:hypothetical protein
LSFASGGTGGGCAPIAIMAALASVVLTAQTTGERDEFRRDRYHAADDYHGGRLDAFVR